MVNQLNIKRLP